MNTIYELINSYSREDAEIRLGETFLTVYLSSGCSKPLRNVSWKTLKELPDAAKYIHAEEELALTLRKALKEQRDTVTHDEAAEQLREMRRGGVNINSIDQAIKTAAVEALYNATVESWESGTIREIGRRLYNALSEQCKSSQPTPLEEAHCIITGIIHKR